MYSFDKTNSSQATYLFIWQNKFVTSYIFYLFIWQDKFVTSYIFFHLTKQSRHKLHSIHLTKQIRHKLHIYSFDKTNSSQATYFIYSFDKTNSSQATYFFIWQNKVVTSYIVSIWQNKFVTSYIFIHLTKQIRHKLHMYSFDKTNSSQATYLFIWQNKFVTSYIRISFIWQSFRCFCNTNCYKLLGVCHVKYRAQQSFCLVKYCA